MEILKRLWAAIGGGEIPGNIGSGDAKAENLKRVLQRCPICGNDFLNHSYALFATTVFAEGNKHRIELLFTALEQHDWLQAVQFQDWDVLSNNVEAYALKCSTGQVALVIIHSPYEVFERDSLIKLEVLNGELGNALISFVGVDRWKPLAA
jgi:hypothetical protein